MILLKKATGKRFVLLAVLVAGLVIASTGVAFAARVANGGFEAGDLGHWTVVDQAGGNGSWFAHTGTTSPLTNTTIAAPPDGSFAAVTDQNAPGSHVLYRNI